MKYEDIKTPEELYSFMKENIKYGFYVKKQDKIYIRKELNNDELYNKTLLHDYIVLSPKELLDKKVGVCYDYVEFERDWLLKHGYKVHTYYTNIHNHAILIYEDNNKYYLFERSIKQFNGIHEDDNIDNLIKMYNDWQVEHDEVFKLKIETTEYDAPKEEVGFYGYILNALKSEEKLQKVKDTIKRIHGYN